ncbi:CgeB family protein [Anaeromyxobacter paludicola]|uniref:Glycosyl transferase n=1 Tax=Anaeromyxobacter paludicola TaxID=2918171 RepID=A0ABM7X6N5_9BACT|nr:glycosyltransferase [Anaeromyxobacter paludicola]BDG07488.1 glycosyl transferase [Anaeromyxobacter paludicola]
MELVVFGLTVSSSWGNGHATLWRGLAAALARAGHRLHFFERDLPFYRPWRDLDRLPAGRLVLYRDWAEALPLAREALARCDAALVTSYCPDALPATALVLSEEVPVRAFYDMDSPVTLSRARAGEEVAYVGPAGLGGFDLVLSYAGGPALAALEETFGARRAVPLYGSVDPGVHRPAAPLDRFRADLSYLGTWAADRQAALEALLLEPARRRPARTFAIAGAQYPADFPWRENVLFVHHLPPAEHPAFYCSSSLTLNVTRGPMAAMGFCPSGRLFEAAACGVAALSDRWEGLEGFFEPGREILVARTAEEATAAVDRPAPALRALGDAARRRVMAHHTADHRAAELVAYLEEARRPARRRAGAEPAPAGA